MARGSDRIDWITSALQDHGLDALICELPENVVMLTGYWPVVGTSVAVVARSGQIAVLAPEDELDLATCGWATDVRTYQPTSLTSLIGPEEAIREPLRALLGDLGLLEGRLGYEDSGIFKGSSYAATFHFGGQVQEILAASAPGAHLISGNSPIAWLRSRMTKWEATRVRLACQIAGDAFTSESAKLRPGQHEAQVANAFAAPMSESALAREDVERAGAFTWCMSGPNSAEAGAAYARTRSRRLQEGDLVLVHCNSYVDGYWTDITRTYCLGEPNQRQRAMYDAVFAAREAALAVIRPGAHAVDVDGAARQVLTDRGFGQYFTHGIGHNVGFSVISADFPPRLHPASPDRLEVGMTFNIEPAIYIKGFGGIRHCDVVTVHEESPQVLTPFQAEAPNLAVRPRSVT
jgi:Xaa-Pro aminopeptidase